jgi:outer membrane protein assembly factor BamA
MGSGNDRLRARPAQRAPGQVAGMRQRDAQPRCAIAVLRASLARATHALLLASFLLAQGASAESTVRRLEFEGDEAVSSRVLKENMLTRGPTWWRFWKPSPTWSEGVLEEDLARIEQTYRNHGYYSAKVTFEIAERKGGESADITFRIDEGEPVRLEAIDIEVGPGSPISADALIEKLPVEIGDVFAVDLYRSARETALATFANLGHPAAQLQGGAEVVVEEHAARIDWRLAPGPEVVFGDVRIEGLERVDQKIVRREIQVHEGEIYSARAIERSRSRVLQLQLFRYVSVQPDKRGLGTGSPAKSEPAADAPDGTPDAAPTDASPEADEHGEATPGAPDTAPAAEPESGEPLVWPIVVQLEERPPRSIALGGGWASGLGPRGTGRWAHRNFFGGARRFVVSGAGSPIEQSASMQLLQPYAFGTEMNLMAESGWRRRHRDSYDTNTVDFNVGPRYSFSEHWLVEGYYRFGWTDINNITDESNDVLRAQKSSGLLSGVGTRLRRTDTDRPIDPHRGTWVQIGIATNLQALGSDFDWMRYDGEGRAYLPLGPTVAAFRVRYQAIQALGSTTPDEVPLGERLFLGGPNTGRGFPFEELGPLDSDGEPVGGVTSLLLSAEWRVPVWGPFTVVGFVDAGQVSLQTFRFQPDNFGIGTGAGLALSTPIGPIAFYAAYPVRPLQVGQKVRVAISIGHAF